MRLLSGHAALAAGRLPPGSAGRSYSLEVRQDVAAASADGPNYSWLEAIAGGAVRRVTGACFGVAGDYY